MDPLSVSASVAGLLTAAQQISTLVGNVSSSRRNGWKEINDIKISLDTLRSILLQLQVLVLGQTTVNRKRASMILVDEVIATLSACVMTFSDVHSCLKSIEFDEKLDLVGSVRWAAKTNKVTGYLRALEAHKTSLNLIVNILTCRSAHKAKQYANDLRALVAQILESNTILTSRMLVVERTVTASTIKRKRTSVSTSISASSVRSHSTLRSLLRTKDRCSDGDHLNQSLFSRFTFEKVLEHSWAHQRAAARGPRTLSLASSTQLAQSWSILSGFSLSQITNIGVQKLPIYANDLQNSEHYSCTDAHFLSSEAQTILEVPGLQPLDSSPLSSDFPAPPSPASIIQRMILRRGGGGKRLQKGSTLSPGFYSGISDLMLKEQVHEDEAACYMAILKEPLMSPTEGYTFPLGDIAEHLAPGLLDNSDIESVDQSAIRETAEFHTKMSATSLHPLNQHPV